VRSSGQPAIGRGTRFTRRRLRPQKGGQQPRYRDLAYAIRPRKISLRSAVSKPLESIDALARPVRILHHALAQEGSSTAKAFLRALAVAFQIAIGVNHQER
jgi:hypothetical protein